MKKIISVPFDSRTSNLEMIIYMKDLDTKNKELEEALNSAQEECTKLYQRTLYLESIITKLKLHGSIERPNRFTIAVDCLEHDSNMLRNKIAYLENIIHQINNLTSPKSTKI